MSMDIHIFIDDIRNASSADCVKYIQQFDIIAQIHPESDFETNSGFLPFRVEFPSCDFLKGKTFLSGFEMSTETHDYEYDLQNTKDTLSKKANGIFRIFKKKENVANKDSEIFVVNPRIDELLKKCGHTVFLDISSVDSFEPILALAFASYLAENCNGIIYYPHSDEYFDKDSIQEVFKHISVFISELSPDSLVCHEFENWL